MHENINLNAVRIRDITSFTGELKCVDGKNIFQVNYDGVSPAYILKHETESLYVTLGQTFSKIHSI